MLSGAPEPVHPPLLVFADDWGRHPSSCQHLVRCLLPQRNVDWINTVGMRAPRFDWLTFLRGTKKVGDWVIPSRGHGPAVASDLRVFNPRMWPWFRRPIDRRINRSLLLAQLSSVIRCHAEPPIAITTLPITADLMGALPVARWVYYCVDDFSQWPGLDHAALEAMEREVVKHADLIITVSETLRERLNGWGRSSHLLTHGVDLRHWSNLVDVAPPAVLKNYEAPWVVFWGMIDRRLDVEMVRRTAEKLKLGTVLLVGPEQNADPALWKSPRIARLPARDFDQLPELARAAAVLIMPYADLPVTRAMQPLKLKEYLATGKPTVVADLPAVREWADCLDIAGTPEEFAAAVALRAQTGICQSQRLARLRLADECWTAKARHFEFLIEGLVEAPASQSNAMGDGRSPTEFGQVTFWPGSVSRSRA